MGTPSLDQISGAGHKDIVLQDAPFGVASRQPRYYNREMEMLQWRGARAGRPAPPFDRYQPNCICWARHSEQCWEYQKEAFEHFIKRQQAQPSDQHQSMRSGGAARGELHAQELRDPLYYTTVEPSSSTGRQHDDSGKQPAFDQAVPTEVEKADSELEVNGGSAQPGDFHSTSHGLMQAPSQPSSEKNPADILKRIAQLVWQVVGSGERRDEEKLHNHSESLKRVKEAVDAQVKQITGYIGQQLNWKDDELKRKDDELKLKDDELKRKDIELKLKDDELKRKGDEWNETLSRINQLNANLVKHNRDVKGYENQIADLTARNSVYQTSIERLSNQLSVLEQTNSEAVGTAGTHKDTPAIPPNLEKSVFVVREVALTCTKAFVAFLKERKALPTHESMHNLPSEASERYRRYEMVVYICSCLFAGFENDCYLDSSDCAHDSEFHLLPNYKDTLFFLANQDLDIRRQQYLQEYDSLLKSGLQGVMDVIKNLKINERYDPFHLFCLRKLVNFMSSVDIAWYEVFELLRDGDYSKDFDLLQQLASNQEYCEKFLKPFVNLAMVTFLLHRLAFQFQPPARIFRYARGTKFDRTYMDTAVPNDDDVSDEELVVALMLVPGFQVGGTIIKCTVYAVHSSSFTT